MTTIYEELKEFDNKTKAERQEYFLKVVSIYRGLHKYTIDMINEADTLRKKAADIERNLTESQNEKQNVRYLINQILDHNTGDEYIE